MLSELFSSTHAKVLTGVLAVQALAFYAMPNTDYVPTMPPLEQMPADIDDWKMVSQSKPEPEIQDILKADDAVTRVLRRGPDSASLFIAFFKTQRAGVVPHSPRVCLPAAGWTPAGSSFVDVPVPGRSEPININRFVVTHGPNKSIVYYWFQSPHHIVASEISSKVHLVMDSIKYRRSDTSIIRIVVAVDERGDAYADKLGIELVKKCFPVVSAHLPS